jgi:hypothetical protein
MQLGLGEKPVPVGTGPCRYKNALHVESVAAPQLGVNRPGRRKIYDQTTHVRTWPRADLVCYRWAARHPGRRRPAPWTLRSWHERLGSARLGPHRRTRCSRSPFGRSGSA